MFEPEGFKLHWSNRSRVTPWKIHMKPTNHPFRKENDLPNLHDYVPCSSSGGASRIALNPKRVQWWSSKDVKHGGDQRHKAEVCAQIYTNILYNIYIYIVVHIEQYYVYTYISLLDPSVTTERKKHVRWIPNHHRSFLFGRALRSPPVGWKNRRFMFSSSQPRGFESRRWRGFVFLYPNTAAYMYTRKLCHSIIDIHISLRLLTPPMETPDPPNDTPATLKQVVLTPHDIPWSLRDVYCMYMYTECIYWDLIWLTSILAATTSKFCEFSSLFVLNFWWKRTRAWNFKQPDFIMDGNGKTVISYVKIWFIIQLKHLFINGSLGFQVSMKIKISAPPAPRNLEFHPNWWQV